MSRGAFDRMDPSDDALFYAQPRKVVHLEEGAIEALRARYDGLLPRSGRILDLMSSWRSHLPADLGPVTGLGMNAEEMADNPQLADFVVHDVNADPRLPFDDDAFTAVVCAVSVQYLTRPVEVLTDVRRVLSPGGPIVISFSNRCFPTKAVLAWLTAGPSDHELLVQGYLLEAGFTDVTVEHLTSPDDPVTLVYGSKGG
jgi:SAM-dependent methyltransferase